MDFRAQNCPRPVDISTVLSVHEDAAAGSCACFSNPRAVPHHFHEFDVAIGSAARLSLSAVIDYNWNPLSISRRRSLSGATWRSPKRSSSTSFRQLLSIFSCPHIRSHAPPAHHALLRQIRALHPGAAREPPVPLLQVQVCAITID
jgi:hypothetical protein